MKSIAPVNIKYEASWFELVRHGDAQNRRAICWQQVNCEGHVETDRQPVDVVDRHLRAPNSGLSDAPYRWFT